MEFIFIFYWILPSVCLVYTMDFSIDYATALGDYKYETCGDSCSMIPSDLDTRTAQFLNTAPCPPPSNLSLICEHSCRLRCSEVAVILNRCINAFKVDCDVVFKVIESCVCDRDMTCSAIQQTYVDKCGVANGQFHCQWKYTGSTSLTQTSTILSSSSSVEDSTEASSTNGNTSSITPVKTTPLIGGSHTLQKSDCDTTCVLIAVLCVLTFGLIVALIVYKCYKRHRINSPKRLPSPVSTLPYPERKTKDTTSSGQTLHVFGPNFISPSFGDIRLGGVKVGRPCSGFYTNMFNGRDDSDYTTFSDETGHLVWSGDYTTPIPLESLSLTTENGGKLMRIPRPSLSTFKYNPAGSCPGGIDAFIGYQNPVYDESVQ